MTDQQLPALEMHLPDVVGTPLEGNPHVQLVYHMLCSNWHPYRVALEMNRRYGIDLPPEVYVDFLNKIPDADLLPTTSLVRHLRNNGIIGDVFMELHGLARYSAERLAHWVETEDNDGKGLSEKVEAALSRHWKRLLELQAIEQQMYVGTQAPLSDPDEHENPTFGDLLNMNAKKTTIRAVEVTLENDK
jgi:hypothetical protein